MAFNSGQNPHVTLVRRLCAYRQLAIPRDSPPPSECHQPFSVALGTRLLRITRPTITFIRENSFETRQTTCILPPKDLRIKGLSLWCTFMIYRLLFRIFSLPTQSESTRRNQVPGTRLPADGNGAWPRSSWSRPPSVNVTIVVAVDIRGVIASFVFLQVGSAITVGVPVGTVSGLARPIVLGVQTIP